MRQERSILAGGCFWGMQDLVRKLDGVITTRVGYSGGDVANATDSTRSPVQQEWLLAPRRTRQADREHPPSDAA